MATADEKRARDAAKAAAAQAVVEDRRRAENKAKGSFGGLSIRAAGDMSRYNIGYSDDPTNPASPYYKPPASKTTPAPTGGGGGGGGGVGGKRVTPVPVNPGLTRRVDAPAVNFPPVDSRGAALNAKLGSKKLYETNPRSVPQKTGRIPVGKGSIGLAKSGSGAKQAGTYKGPPKMGAKKKGGTLATKVAVPGKKTGASVRVAGLKKAATVKKAKVAQRAKAR